MSAFLAAYWPWLAAAWLIATWPLGTAIGRRLRDRQPPAPVVAKWDATQWWHGYHRHLTANTSDAITAQQEAGR